MIFWNQGQILSIYAAFALDYIAGDPYWFPHPVRLIGIYITKFEECARKIAKNKTGLLISGVLLTFSAVIFSYIAAWMLLNLAYSINTYLYYAINILLLYICISARCLSFEGMKIFRALVRGDIEGGRRLLSFIVGRDTENLSESEIARGAVETIAENTSDGVVAPLFYMFIGGAPMAMAYKAINTLDSMVGYKNDKYIYFGWASARLDDIANFIPARLTGLLMVAASVFLKFDYVESFRVLKRDCMKHSSPNSGYPESAAAGALNIQLGGINYYFGKPVVKPVIGNLGRTIISEDIEKAIKLMYVSSAEALIILSVFSAIMGGLL